jgi:hypothetical protein
MTCIPLLCVRSRDRERVEHHAPQYEGPNFSIQPTRFARG